jgi:8-oxo-dGTP diphosphatase
MQNTVPDLQVAVGVVMDSADRVLVARRPEGRHLAGYWEFPGGKCERDEAPEVALVRELHEECGLEILDGQPLVTLDWQYQDAPSVRLHSFLCTKFRGKARGMEGQHLEWKPLALLPSLKMPPPNRHILARLQPQPFS